MSDVASGPPEPDQQEAVPQECGPEESAPAELFGPLDFSGAVRLSAPAADRPAPAPAAPPEEVLVAHCFGDKAVLLPSDGAARSVMLETIRTHHRLVGRPKRRRLLVCAGGMDLPPELAADPDVEVVPDDPGAVRAAIDPQTAGLLISPVRLQAGLEFVSGAFLAELREAADEYGLALVFDETDAGLGRTGMAFAHEWTGVTPDLMLVGQATGLAVSALVLGEKYVRARPQARPAVADADRAQAEDMLARVLAEGFEARIQTLGWFLEDGLSRLRYGRADLFCGHLGTGLIQGLVCVGGADALAERVAAAGLTVCPMGEVLVLLPPLDVTEAELATAIARLEEVVAQMETAPA